MRFFAGFVNNNFNVCFYRGLGLKYIENPCVELKEWVVCEKSG